MLIMRKIICCFLFLITLASSGQKTSINLQISSSSDPEIIAVRNFWQGYIDDLIKSPLTNKESIQKKYWNNIELQQGFTDITLGEFPFYTIGELLTFEITKESNGFYRIRCMVLIINSTIRSVFSIYDVYAKKIFQNLNCITISFLQNQNYSIIKQERLISIILRAITLISQ